MQEAATKQESVMWTIISQFFEVLDSIGLEGEVDEDEVVYCTRVVELVIDLLVC